MLKALLPHFAGDPFTRRWWLRTLALDGVIVAVVFVAIQLVPVAHHNPPVVHEPVWDSPEIRALAVQACFDCHSNQTQYPWYGRIAPASWILWYDVTQGREHLNFSEWDRFVTSDQTDPNDPFPPKTLSERIAQVIDSGRMPPGTYRLANPEARLTDDQKTALIAGLIRTVKQNQEPP